MACDRIPRALPWAVEWLPLRGASQSPHGEPLTTFGRRVTDGEHLCTNKKPNVSSTREGDLMPADIGHVTLAAGDPPGVP